MFEVEYKFALADPEQFVAALAQYGQLGAVVTEMDTFYQHPDRDFVATDEALRWRLPQGVLTYKGPKLQGAAKSRKEIELAVADPTQLLQALGFGVAATLTKHRRTCSIGELTVTLDEVPGLGTFCELELLSEEPTAAESQLALWQQRLGIQGEPILESYLELQQAAKS